MLRDRGITMLTEISKGRQRYPSGEWNVSSRSSLPCLVMNQRAPYCTPYRRLASVIKLPCSTGANGMSIRAFRSVVALVLLLGEGYPVAVADCSQRHNVTAFGKVDTKARQIDQAHSSAFITEIDARYLRARIVVSAPSNCAWSLTVRDEYLRPVQTFSAIDFQPTAVVWTSRVNGSQLVAELHGCDANTGPSLTISRVLWMPTKTVLGPDAYYSLKSFGMPDWKELYVESPIRASDPARLETGDAVGILVLSTDKGAWSCSGFMLTGTLFLTNYHCGANEDLGPQPGDYWNGETIHNAILDTSWDTDEISREFLVSSVEQADPVLDFAVLRVRPLGATAPISVGILADWIPAQGDSLYTIHHPLGMRKTYSGACGVKAVCFPNRKQPTRKTDFTHDCDTEPGSSGAPVFDKYGEIVGVHHLQYDFDKACRVTSENKAIAMREILAALKSDIKTQLLIHETPPGGGSTPAVTCSSDH
jgi:hypothetical protein